ncbi:MAG: CDP-diacylglycerol--glycerol-3-phosphate 3-phosphatidyltransferase [Ruminococcaceae bacterium]|nr:CDP-diacylglycerol--glycerol-3-phosphate 3-phosphatidyltransferase [Oscillospiraceae bacterium]
MKNEKKKMNLPNKLSLIRLCMVPVIVIVGMLTPKYNTNGPSIAFYISSAFCALLFIAAAVTDALDGKIARRDGLITDFGKFIDPIADKFMVIGALFVLLFKFKNLEYIMIATLIIVVFRELAITSIRLVAANASNVVLAANILGKVKTVTQVVAISTVFLEPVVQWIIKLIVEAIVCGPVAWRYDILPLTWISIALSLVMTLWSGIAYIKGYWKYLDPEK